MIRTSSRDVDTEDGFERRIDRPDTNPLIAIICSLAI